MRIAFTIALLATLGLAYSVFFHDGLCSGKKDCNLTPVSTAKPGTCTAGCCSKSAATTEFVSLQDGEEETCSKGKCCSEGGVCSKGGQCCSEGHSHTSSVALKQDGECCEGKCSAGGSCCQDGKGMVTVSIAKQDGESCEGKCSAGGSCCQKGDATTTVSIQDECEAGKCEAGKTCCVAAAMKKLPAMTFKVGTESTCCSDAAAKLAEKSGEAIHFVVADEEFDSKEKAFTALVEKTEAYVNNFITPAKCEASGQTSLCEKSFACSQEAAKNAELIVNATKEIKVGYQVGEKSACCANGAKALAAKENAPIEYVVSGEKTKCEMHARLLVAQAKYAAAVKAMAATEPAASTDATTTKTATKSETSSNG